MRALWQFSPIASEVDELIIKPSRPESWPPFASLVSKGVELVSAIKLVLHEEFLFHLGGRMVFLRE